jgi:hypothetical protein
MYVIESKAPTGAVHRVTALIVVSFFAKGRFGG